MARTKGSIRDVQLKKLGLTTDEQDVLVLALDMVSVRTPMAFTEREQGIFLALQRRLAFL